MANTMFVIVNVVFLLALLGLCSVATYVSLSMLWGNLKAGLHHPRPRKDYNVMDFPTPQDA